MTWRDINTHHTGLRHRHVIVLAELDFDTKEPVHMYSVVLRDPGSHQAHKHLDIVFQNGPFKEKGVNGLTCESLIAILMDRLVAVSRGDLATHESMMALVHLQLAMEWLKQRTRDRRRRGVEGTMKP